MLFVHRKQKYVVKMKYVITNFRMAVKVVVSPFLDPLQWQWLE